MAILDEIDSGLDIDALRDVANSINGLKRPNNSILMVTHYKVSRHSEGESVDEVLCGVKLHRLGSLALTKRCVPAQRLLDYIKPDFVHIMQSGQIVKTGDVALADQLETAGYAMLR